MELKPQGWEKKSYRFATYASAALFVGVVADYFFHFVFFLISIPIVVVLGGVALRAYRTGD